MDFLDSLRAFDTSGFGSSTLRHFGTSATSGLRALRALRDFEHFGHFDTSSFGPSGLRDFGTSRLRPLRDFDSSVLRYFGTSGFDPSRNSQTSRFKTPEAHFPKHLDQMPSVPFKIYDSCLFRDFGIFPSLYLVQF